MIHRSGKCLYSSNYLKKNVPCAVSVVAVNAVVVNDIVVVNDVVASCFLAVI